MLDSLGNVERPIEPTVVPPRRSQNERAWFLLDAAYRNARFHLQQRINESRLVLYQGNAAMLSFVCFHTVRKDLLAAYFSNYLGMPRWRTVEYHNLLSP